MKLYLGKTMTGDHAFNQVSRRKGLVSRVLAKPVALLMASLLASGSMQANTILWSGASSSAWLGTTSWTGNTVPTAGDVAQFGANPTSPTVGVGINFNATTNAGTQVTGQRIEDVGAIEVTSARSNNLLVGNSSSTAGATGTLRLNGVTVNGVNNVVLRSNATGGTLTIQNTQGSGNQTMAVTLANATDNIVSIENVGNIAITSVINGAGHLTRSGAGTGLLTLSGANTFSGGATVSVGELRVTNTTGSGTGTGAVTVGNNLGVATLSGTGTISGLVTTATTGANIAHLAPGLNTGGTNFGGIGTLTLSGGLTLGDGTNLDFDLGTSSDLITVATSLTLGNAITLNVTQGTGFSAAQTYNLFTYTGTLAGAANLATWTFTGVPTATSAIFADTGSAITVMFASTITPNYFDTNGSAAGIGINGGTAVWDTSTTNWNPINTGTGAPKTFDPSQPTFFGGTSGAVTVDAGGVAANAGLQFISDGYTLSGGAIALGGTTPTITVQNSGETATINSGLSGSGGLTKAGAGKLVLGGTNTFTGDVKINAGTLAISSNSNLGDPINGVLLNSSTLQVTSTVVLPDTRTLDGTGTLAVASGLTLTVNGPVGAITPGALTFSDSGTVALTNAFVNAVTGLTFNAPMTLNLPGTALVLNGTAPITAANTTGTVTITGALDAGATAHTVSVAAGGTLAMSATLTGSGSFSKANSAGTWLLTGNSAAFSGTITLGGTTNSGGILGINNKNALGGSGTFNFDTGTLRNDSATPLTGTDAIPKSVSIGAFSTGSGAVLAGADMEFTGGVSIFKSGTNQQLLVVNNTTTFSGVFGLSTGTGTSTGLTIAGTGTLILSGSSPNTFTEPVIVGNGAITGTVLDIAKDGGLVGNAVTIKNGATLRVGDLLGPVVTGTISGASTVQSGGTIAGLGTTGDIALQSGSFLSPGAPTKSLGTLTATNLTWDGGATMKFELSAVDNTSDKLSLGTGVLTKGAAGAFLFDFGNTGAGGQTYQLLTFGSTTFSLSDFTSANLPSGVTGNFVLSGSDLTFVTVPEPGSAALACLGLAGLALRRRRRS